MAATSMNRIHVKLLRFELDRMTRLLFQQRLG